ncbi:MAG: HD domain-containing phosphohydrolase [Pseudomonadota bacterium]
MRNLLPVEIGIHLLDAPLPHDLYNQQGVLIARGGSVISDPERLARLAAMRLLRPSQGEDSLQASPYQTLQEIARQYDSLLHPTDNLDIQALIALADALRLLVLGHPELALGMTNHLDLASLARRHSLHAAAIALLLAQDMGLSEAGQLTVVCGALTMNLASHDLQDRMSCSPAAPSGEDQAQLRLHAWHSAEMLARLGVDDARWLMAVSQHHENLDGSGYPFGVLGSAITQEARILRAADVWSAFLSHRHGRVCRYPRQALRDLFRRERGKLDDAVMLALRRLMGYYPPGTLVRLANRETALVTRWFERRSRPAYVISLLRPTGNPVGRHQARDTSRPDYAIRDYTYLPLFHNTGLDWSRVWAAG